MSVKVISTSVSLPGKAMAAVSSPSGVELVSCHVAEIEVYKEVVVVEKVHFAGSLIKE
jgi:hypothetical protein